MKKTKVDFRISKDVIWRREGENVILFDKKKYKLFQLNKTASIIWELLATNKSSEDIINHMKSIFDTEEKKLLRDVTKFIKRADQLGLLEVIE